MINLLLANPIIVISVVVLLFLLFKSIVNAKGDEVVVLERRWFGASMPETRTVAKKNEVGVQARILGPGLRLLIPFIYKRRKYKFITIKKGEVGLVTAITGEPLESGQLFARPVECNLYQDGEAFLTNGGQKGPQVAILPDGEHRINPYLFQVEIVNVVVIGEDEVGNVESIAGEPCDKGRIFGKPVDCEDYQNAEKFLANKGQKGPQIRILGPGNYRINTMLFKVSVERIISVSGGYIGLVTAMDGAAIPEGRLLGRKTEGHLNFVDGEAFITNGGEKGRQLDVLMPGQYRINTSLFRVDTSQSWTSISADEIGIVTVNEGLPILDAAKIAADEVPLNKHNNFQDPAAFLAANGQKGLQIPVLRSGNYAINPWFASIEKVKMTLVEIGKCGVVTSYVGEKGEDTTDSKVNAKIVENGFKGIWQEPLGPGKHPINTKTYKVDMVPTNQITLSWADSRTNAHDLDSNLKTITLRTADAFSVNMDVNVIIHIPMANAPKVIANQGSIQSLISQVLEPAISSHFRNAAQYIKALDLYTQRKELQATAKTHIIEVLKEHFIDSKDTLIADVVLPQQLTKIVSDKQIAEQEKITYKTQTEAEEQRKMLANMTAQADMQPKVVDSERGVEISKNIANSEVEKAIGAAKAVELAAEGAAKATKLKANAEAEATRVTAVAQAEATSKVGLAEAEVILAKGKSTAESYKLQTEAMGKDVFGQIQVVEKIAASNMKLIPDMLITGGGGQGSSNLENMMGIMLMEKMSGKKFDIDNSKKDPDAVK
ncbi:MAG: hypothetical protein K0Q79_3232 [Flavipsychrobacter sp.]|jgi:uncharacterized membrane protein YqiK|nr:hypothetical protein [Flavipsychrobacter sp.]